MTDAIRVLSETALRDYLKMGLVVALPVESGCADGAIRLLLSARASTSAGSWGCSSNCCAEKSRFFDFWSVFSFPRRHKSIKLTFRSALHCQQQPCTVERASARLEISST